MTTDEYAKCPRCGRYDLKGFVQDYYVYIYCPHCHNNFFLCRNASDKLIESEESE